MIASTLNSILKLIAPWWNYRNFKNLQTKLYLIEAKDHFLTGAEKTIKIKESNLLVINLEPGKEISLKIPSIKGSIKKTFIHMPTWKFMNNRLKRWDSNKDLWSLSKAKQNLKKPAKMDLWDKTAHRLIQTTRNLK